MNQSQCPIIAIDLPSGLHGDTGAVCGSAISATHTITFVGRKRGLYTGRAADHVGKLIFTGLGVDTYFAEVVNSTCALISREKVKDLLPKRDRSAHKGDFGRVLCLGGDRGMYGAIRLTSEACLRMGAGLTRVVTQPENVSAIVSARPELMVYDWRGNSNEINNHLYWANVIAIGPGLGGSSWGRSLVGYSRTVDKPIVADADAINLLAKSPDFNSKRVVTPHPGEAARLLGCTVEEIESDRFAAAEQIQFKYGGVVVLKGAGTLIFNGKEYWVCDAGNPGMATGGMGDVLTGIIAACLAQGLSLSNAACVGVWIHSRAADISAEREGERGMLASHLFEFIRPLANGLL